MMINGGRAPKVNRMAPRLPAHLYKTFAVRSPLSTHHRRATCEEVACAAYLNGWNLRIDDLPEELIVTAKRSGRHWNMVRITEGEVDEDNFPIPGTYMIFPPGQSCFRESTHTVPLDRPEFYLVGRGDYRTFSPRTARTHKRPADWVDEFKTHVDKLNTEIQKG